ncbi:hypothetical protein CEXT_87531 [Caerostris extrusa]|uniref:Uncharacterized protein n=1 Tax=Caerostris extrusa TaxID=172846 RepID=A0AAV4Y195_CAEEX|nr:hypothetical protein CEXT_87531 [Caerostris extrusa]
MESFRFSTGSSPPSTKLIETEEEKKHHGLSQCHYFDAKITPECTMLGKKIKDNQVTELVMVIVVGKCKRDVS